MRVLIANPFGIGDMLFSLPLVRAIRAAEPDAFIGILCNARTEELVSCWPELDWRHTFEKDEFRRRWKSSRRMGMRCRCLVGWTCFPPMKKTSGCTASWPCSRPAGVSLAPTIFLSSHCGRACRLRCVSSWARRLRLRLRLWVD